MRLEQREQIARMFPEGNASGLIRFQPLYKKTNTGAINVWTVLVTGRTIHTTYGLMGGALQKTSDEVKAGKNLGKRNATTPEQQAVLDAEAKWRKKQEREGYVASLERAQMGETDAQGGIAPMLAQPFDKAVKHIKYPVDCQKKFNGVRCIVEVIDEEVTLWSRRRVQIFGVPHIVEAYRRAFKDMPGHYIFDGELYHHGWSLQRISGYVRKKNDPKEGFEHLSHFLYDYATEHPWQDRKDTLDLLFREDFHEYPVIQPVHTAPAYNFLQVKSFHNAWVQEGYEGAILRNRDGFYEAGKRSYDLIKYKDFKDGEFEIVGITDGRGRMEGKAVFQCVTEAGREFECVAPGSLEEKADLFRRRDEVIGKKATVRFLELTEAGLPSQATAVAVRDYE